MKKKFDPYKLSPEELEEYTKNLPKKIPPSWTTIGWSAAFTVLLFAVFIFRVKTTSFAESWTNLVGAIGVLGITSYLIYKKLNFKDDDS